MITNRDRHLVRAKIFIRSQVHLPIPLKLTFPENALRFCPNPFLCAYSVLGAHSSKYAFTKNKKAHLPITKQLTKRCKAHLPITKGLTIFKKKEGEKERNTSERNKKERRKAHLPIIEWLIQVFGESAQCPFGECTFRAK